MKDNEYKCDACGEIYEYGWTEEEAKKESVKNWGENMDIENEETTAIICDDCYKKLMPTIFN